MKMKSIGDYFENARIAKITTLLADIDMFIMAYHEEMSREEFHAFQIVCDYLADMEVSE